MESRSIQSSERLLCPGIHGSEPHFYHNSQLLDCTHHVCYQCAVKILSNAHNCPVCKKRVFSYSPDREFSKVVEFAQQILNLKTPLFAQRITYPFERGSFQTERYTIDKKTSGLTSICFENKIDQPIVDFFIINDFGKYIELTVDFKEDKLAREFFEYLKLNNIRAYSFCYLVVIGGLAGIKSFINLFSQHNDFDRNASNILHFFITNLEKEQSYVAKM